MGNSQRRFLAQHIVALLEQCCNHSKQCRNNVEMTCCVKNHRCKLSRVTSPLVFINFVNGSIFLFNVYSSEAHAMLDVIHSFH